MSEELYWIKNSEDEYLYEEEPEYFVWGRPYKKDRTKFTKEQASEQMRGLGDCQGVLVK